MFWGFFYFSDMHILNSVKHLGCSKIARIVHCTGLVEVNRLLIDLTVCLNTQRPKEQLT